MADFSLPALDYLEDEDELDKFKRFLGMGKRRPELDTYEGDVVAGGTKVFTDFLKGEPEEGIIDPDTGEEVPLTLGEVPVGFNKQIGALLKGIKKGQQTIKTLEHAKEFAVTSRKLRVRQGKFPRAGERGERIMNPSDLPGGISGAVVDPRLSQSKKISDKLAGEHAYVDGLRNEIANLKRTAEKADDAIAVEVKRHRASATGRVADSMVTDQVEKDLKTLHGAFREAYKDTNKLDPESVRRVRQAELKKPEVEEAYGRLVDFGTRLEDMGLPYPMVTRPVAKGSQKGDVYDMGTMLTNYIMSRSARKNVVKERLAFRFGTDWPKKDVVRKELLASAEVPDGGLEFATKGMWKNDAYEAFRIHEKGKKVVYFSGRKMGVDGWKVENGVRVPRKYLHDQVAGPFKTLSEAEDSARMQYRHFNTKLSPVKRDAPGDFVKISGGDVSAEKEYTRQLLRQAKASLVEYEQYLNMASNARKGGSKIAAEQYDMLLEGARRELDDISMRLGITPSEAKMPFTSAPSSREGVGLNPSDFNVDRSLGKGDDITSIFNPGEVQ